MHASGKLLRRLANNWSLTTTFADMESAVIAASRAYPKPANFKPDYGTAGFRAEASLLASTVFRCVPSHRPMPGRRPAESGP